MTITMLHVIYIINIEAIRKAMEKNFEIINQMKIIFRMSLNIRYGGSYIITPPFK